MDYLAEDSDFPAVRSGKSVVGVGDFRIQSTKEAGLNKQRLPARQVLALRVRPIHYDGFPS
ncbi:MAG: hypothetical protein EA425_13995 [Puniceicoccaceae bacterium]|nr:MAG: hypothetical protein EA425_13995 [Puniceicoccaceae bacterium]